MTRGAPTPAPGLVDHLFNAAFHAARDPRSLEYKTGAIALLDLRVHGNPILRPYVPGTAQADAFWAGVDEGRAIWRDYQKAQSEAARGGNQPDGA
jgi:hypothetical protein